MQEYIKRVLKRVEDKNFEKSEWEADVLALESAVRDFLNEKGYLYKDTTIDLFRQTPEERLDEISKIKKEKSDSISTLIYAVEFYEDILKKYLDYYNLGYLKHFQLKNNGLFHVEINTYLTEPFGMENEKQTVKNKFKKQLEILENCGFQLKFRNGSYRIAYSDKAIKAFQEIFGFLNPIRLSFKIDNNEIQSISFHTNQKSLDQLKIPTLVLKKTEEEERENKRIFLTGRFRDLSDMIATVQSMPDMLETCGSLIEICFSDICECLEVETELSKQVRERYQNDKKVNMHIHALEEDIKNGLDSLDMTETVKKYYETLSKKIEREIGFCVEEFKINKISYEFELKSYELNHMKLLNEDFNKDVLEHIKNIFDIIELKSECYIVYSERNLKYINSYIDTYKLGEADTFLTKRRFSQFYIHTIKITGFRLPEINI